jgi:hypothetical protein
MDFEEITHIEHPARRVVDTMIWKLETLVPFMPNVSGIETREMSDLGDGRIACLRHWQGTSATVPAVLRPFVTKNSLGWLDHATWYPGEYKVEWRIESGHSKYTRCEGVNIFEPDPAAPETRTRCIIRGVFEVQGDKLPAVPTFMGRKLAPTIERIILGYMLPNFRQLSEGLGRCLDAADATPREAQGEADSPSRSGSW